MSKKKLVLDTLPEDCQDPYLLALQKKNRNFLKKIKEIESLEKQPKSELKEGQLQKIQRKDDLVEQRKELNGRCKEYQEIVKEYGEGTQQEKPQQQQSEQTQEVVEKVVEKVVEVTKVVENTENYQRILNLSFVGQFFAVESRRQDFTFDSNLEAYVAFYKKVFNVEGVLGDRLSTSFVEIKNYLARSESKAVGSTSYRQLFDGVEALVSNSTFTSANGQVQKKVVKQEVKQQEAPKKQEEQPKQVEQVEKAAPVEEKPAQKVEQQPEEETKEPKREQKGGRRNQQYRQKRSTDQTEQQQQEEQQQQGEEEQQQPVVQEEEEEDGWNQVKKHESKKPQYNNRGPRREGGDRNGKDGEGRRQYNNNRGPRREGGDREGQTRDGPRRNNNYRRRNNEEGGNKNVQYVKKEEVQQKQE